MFCFKNKNKFSQNEEFFSNNAKYERFYFVDFENVGSTGFKNIEDLTSKDSVHIFYSKNASTISIEIANKLHLSEANVVYHKVETGKNALDFQLSSFLGYAVNSNTKAIFFIISKDNGFLCLEEYWRNFNISVKRACSICETNIEFKTIDAKVIQKQKQFVVFEKIHKIDSSLLKEEVFKYVTQKSDVDIICQCIQESNTFETLHNSLSRHYKDNEKTKEIYFKVKPLIALLN